MTYDGELIPIGYFVFGIGGQIVVGELSSAEDVVVILKAAVEIKMADGIAEPHLTQDIGLKMTVNRDHLFIPGSCQVGHPHLIDKSKQRDGCDIEGEVAEAADVFTGVGIPVIQNPVERITGP